MIQRLSTGLLGRHVRWGAGAGVGRDRAVARYSQAKIQDYRPPGIGVEPDVGGLEVPVDEAPGVRGLQPGGHVPTDPDQLLG
jgi:hypothetical protein